MCVCVSISFSSESTDDAFIKRSVEVTHPFGKALGKRLQIQTQLDIFDVFSISNYVAGFFFIVFRNSICAACMSVARHPLYT